MDLPYRYRACDEYEQLLHDWDSLVYYYSERSLTVAADNLVAISGLVKDMYAKPHETKPVSL